MEPVKQNDRERPPTEKLSQRPLNESRIRGANVEIDLMTHWNLLVVGMELRSRSRGILDII